MPTRSVRSIMRGELARFLLLKNIFPVSFSSYSMYCPAASTRTGRLWMTSTFSPVTVLVLNRFSFSSSGLIMLSMYTLIPFAEDSLDFPPPVVVVSSLARNQPSCPPYLDEMPFILTKSSFGKLFSSFPPNEFLTSPPAFVPSCFIHRLSSLVLKSRPRQPRR